MAQDARREFLSRLGTGALAAGAFGAGAGAIANAQSPVARTWQPARHQQDDWLDQIPGSHRFIIDTTSPAGMDAALLFANNYYVANLNEYGLKESDLAIVIVARHDSTGFAFNESMWAKYGASFTKRSGFVDPSTKRAPETNVYRGRIEGMTKRGLHFAVCQMATQNLAMTINGGPGAEVAKIYAELTANLLSANAHMVPAGIVAVNRAQERGYSFAHGV